MTPTRILAFASAATFSVAALAGCGALDNNQGGDTTCGDCLERSNDDERAVITTCLDEQGNSSPAGFEVNLALQSAKLYCNTMGSADDPIRDIETG